MRSAVISIESITASEDPRVRSIGARLTTLEARAIPYPLEPAGQDVSRLQQLMDRLGPALKMSDAERDCHRLLVELGVLLAGRPALCTEASALLDRQVAWSQQARRTIARALMSAAGELRTLAQEAVQ